ncbi:MAG: RNA polymerase sigma-70 factor [Cytophagales bacterium]|nr:RNA polymerase sigma-70 factor [Cytophagales bacterium]
MTSGTGDIELKEIIKKIAIDDDQLAFKNFFDHFYPQMFNLAHYYLKSNQASEEVVSAVFVGIWNNRIRLPEIAKLEAYLFSSVKNKCFSYLQSNRLMHLRIHDSEESMLIPAMNDPEFDLCNKELKERIFSAIEALPPRCKTIFIMIRIDGLKYKEVAELLEISPKTVEVQLGRALIKLRKTLLPYIEEMDLKQYIKSRTNLSGILLGIYF